MKFIGNPVEVDAFVITEVEDVSSALRPQYAGSGYGLTLKLENGDEVVATPPMLARIMPTVGDYWVRQADGYEYINPKDVFERKYSPMPTDYLDLRRQIGDFRSTFYGPHKCQWCDALVIKQAAEQGGVAWVLIKGEDAKYMVHQEPIKVNHGQTDNPR